MKGIQMHRQTAPSTNASGTAHVAARIARHNADLRRARRRAHLCTLCPDLATLALIATGTALATLLAVIATGAGQP